MSVLEVPLVIRKVVRKKEEQMTTYKTTGTCSLAINYEVEDGIVTKCEFVGGCPGNTQGGAALR